MTLPRLFTRRPKKHRGKRAKVRALRMSDLQPRVAVAVRSSAMHGSSRDH